MTDIEAIRRELEQFNAEIERETYLSRSGQKDDVDTASIYARYAHIFESLPLIEEVRDLRAAARGLERLRLNYLYASLAAGYISGKNTELDDQVNRTLAKAEIEVDGKQVPFQYSAVLLANEPDRARRAAIDGARDEVIGQVHPLQRQLLEQSYSLAEALGYGNYVELCGDLTGIDLYALRAQLQNFLYRTDRLYTRHFKGICQSKLGIGLADVRKHDISRLFRALEFDGAFDGGRMMPVLEATLAGLGLDGARNITIDAEPREKKVPRAFCCGIVVPDEVVLCIRPKGGYDDYRALFHEMGHAQHFGHVAREQPFEFKYLGDVSVTESYAFLFEHLTGNRDWLGQRMGLPGEGLQRLVQFSAFQRLFMVRRYAAKLIYELELHSGAAEPEKVYARTLGDALKFRHQEGHYLFDLDPGFYSAGYLRAWLFEVQLRSALQEQFGTEWWNDRRAGAYLIDRWGMGQKYDCGQMARDLGFYGIDEGPLIRELERALRQENVPRP